MGWAACVGGAPCLMSARAWEAGRQAPAKRVRGDSRVHPAVPGLRALPSPTSCKQVLLSRSAIGSAYEGFGGGARWVGMGIALS
jgi:hypothetical protein